MWNIIEFDEVSSTNAVATKMLARGEARHGDVLQARHQTSGRGRGAGRVWSDEPGASLLMSIVLTQIPEPAHLLQYRVALSVLEALRNLSEEFRSEIVLKWPNDIFLHEKKVCGILLEAQWNASAMRSAIVGIGVNVRQHSFPDELAGIATSLEMCRIATDVNEVRNEILDRIQLEIYLNTDVQGSILAQLRDELAWMSELPSISLVRTDHTTLSNLRYEDITNVGALLLRNVDGSLLTVHSGSLTWDTARLPIQKI